MRFRPILLLLAAPLLAADDFRLQPGLFPPDGTSRSISGELIALDHINRTGTLRPDRTDAQRRGDWDLPLDFTLLPFGSIRCHGAPAELRDIPIGTHLHGEFYTGEVPAADPKVKPAPSARKLSADARFSRVLRFEDDFSRSLRLKHEWRVDAIALDTGTLTVTGITAGKPDARPTVFQISPATRVWKGRGIGTPADVKPGQSVLLNLTVCTLKGPGRVTNLWLDAESRALATAHQLEVHRHFMREHGLAGWIDGVDNAQGIVTVTLFDAFDPTLKADFPLNDSITAAVAEENLRTWDQINDRKSGPVTEVLSVPSGPGNSGLRLRFKPSLLLEGFRPERIIRIWSSKWKVDDLPREERMYQ